MAGAGVNDERGMGAGESFRRIPQDLQREALEKIVDGQDVFFFQPTGSRKFE